MRVGEGMPRAAITMVSAVTASNSEVTCGFIRLAYAPMVCRALEDASLSSTFPPSPGGGVEAPLVGALWGRGVRVATAYGLVPAACCPFPDFRVSRYATTSFNCVGVMTFPNGGMLRPPRRIRQVSSVSLSRLPT